MLDKQLAALLDQSRAAGVPDLCELPPLAARGLYRQLMSASGSPAEPVEARDLRIAGVAPGTTIGVRLYAPPAAHSWPVVVWYHGGGYVLGDLDGYDGVCRQLALDAQAVVVAVDYRLAPEHPYPAAFDDAWLALRWVASADGARELGAAADTTRLAVAGDSAGAALATSVCLLARDSGGPSIAFQALAYPPAAGGHDGDFPSRERHAAGPTLTRATTDYFGRLAYGPAAKVTGDLRGAPLHAASLAALPPTLLLIAALDPLRDEVVAFGQRLAGEGNAVTAIEYLGLAHGFIGQGAVVKAARAAQRQFGQALRDTLHQRPRC
jgi:acetyl esterase